MTSKKLHFALILAVMGIIVGSALHIPVLATDQDPLFPDNPVTKNHIKEGLKLLFTTNITQEASRLVSYDMALEKGCDDRSFPGLCLGTGSSKIAIKINPDSNKLILLWDNERLAQKEYQAYKIFNAFGLISQQDPEIVTVKFQNRIINNILCVLSFDFLAHEGTNRRTWDTKNYKGFGNILFFNGNENYADINYHRQFLLPLVKDVTLWFVMGKPSTMEIDSLNLIFKKTNDTQTICRLLIYDIYSWDEDVFQDLKKTYNNMNDQRQYISYWPIEASIKQLYRKTYEAMLPTEKAELWGKTEKDWKNYSCPINMGAFTSNWKKLEPLIIQDFKTEVDRIITLFNKVANSQE